jgi:hypothetical protein
MRSLAFCHATISIAVFLLSGCRASQAGRETFPDAGRSQELHKQVPRPDDPPAPTWADLEKMPKVVMAEPSIEIAAQGTSKSMMLRFRLRPYIPGGTSTTIPRIEKITIGKAEEFRRRGKPECLIRADQAVSMKEWRYGDTPPGFTKVGCAELGPGEHVISVQFLGGYGGVRIVVDEKGTVTPHPLKGSTEPLWDGK